MKYDYTVTRPEIENRLVRSILETYRWKFATAEVAAEMRESVIKALQTSCSWHLAKDCSAVFDVRISLGEANGTVNVVPLNMATLLGMYNHFPLATLEEADYYPTFEGVYRIHRESTGEVLGGSFEPTV